jgi:hypothetical protein
MTETSRSWQPPEGALCGKCSERPPGPGGILCPECKKTVEARIYPSKPPSDGLGGEGDEQ